MDFNFFATIEAEKMFNEKGVDRLKYSTKCFNICGCVKCNTQNGEAFNEFRNYFYELGC